MTFEIQKMRSYSKVYRAVGYNGVLNLSEFDQGLGILFMGHHIVKAQRIAAFNQIMNGFGFGNDPSNGWEGQYRLYRSDSTQLGAIAPATMAGVIVSALGNYANHPLN